MLVSDLFEDMAPSALDQVLNGANKMATLYADNLTYLVKNLYAEGMHDDMYRTTKTMVGRAKGKWFADNYLSTSDRRNSPTSGLKNGLNSLTRDSRYGPVKDLIKQLATLEIQMDADVRSRKEVSFGQNMTQLESLPNILDRIASLAGAHRDKVRTTAARLRNAIDGFYNMWERLHTEWDKKWGKQSDIDKEKEQKQKARKDTQQTNGVQANQADVIINQVLGSLDKKVANEIRIAISRQDNKLLALQKELTRRNIQM
jgi:hypothetical protein